MSDPKSDTENLSREVHVIKATQISLARAVEQNTQAFSDAFHMTDCHIHVMQRAMNDMLLDRVYRTGEGGVDFTQYMMEYWATVGFIDFVRGLKTISKEDQSLISTADEEVVVFGGL